MRSSSLIGMMALVVATTSGCGSDVANSEPSAGTTSGTSGTGGGGGAGGDATTTTTTSAGGAGGEGGSGQGGAGGAPACMSFGDACTTCLYSECNMLYCECYQTPDCTDLVVCLQQCPANDQACTQTCATMHEDGISKAFLLGGCSSMACDAQCPGGVGTTIGPCEQCLFTKCETQMNSCLADPECVAAIECAQQCPSGNFQCAQMCTAGNGPAQTALACAGFQCSSECQ